MTTRSSAAAWPSCSSTRATSRWSASPARPWRRPAASRRSAPDVAILDARLPDGNGIDVCRDVRAVDPSIKGLILTSYEDDEALFAAIMAGAAGYVLKQIRGTDLVDAVRRVAAGQSLLDPAVTARVLERIRHGVEEPRELKTAHRAGTPDPGVRRRGADQPRDRRRRCSWPRRP